MLVKSYDQNGKEKEEVKLPQEIFDAKINPDLLYQVVVSQTANRRKNVAHTKNRGEVRGGGKKPWKQKGTGRARHGSIRSPLWKGGGVVFGPRKDRVFKKKINKKAKNLALFMALSSKVKDNTLIVLDNFPTENIKTKVMAGVLKNLGIDKHSCLVGLESKDSNLYKAFRNISKVKTEEVKNITAFDVLSYKYFVMPKDAVKVIEKTFLKK